MTLRKRSKTSPTQKSPIASSITSKGSPTEHGRKTADGIAIDVALTHGDIASAIGSTRETVSLELSKLVKSGRVKQEGRTFVLPDEVQV